MDDVLHERMRTRYVDLLDRIDEWCPPSERIVVSMALHDALARCRAALSRRPGRRPLAPPRPSLR